MTDPEDVVWFTDQLNELFEQARKREMALGDVGVALVLGLGQLAVCSEDFERTLEMVHRDLTIYATRLRELSEKKAAEAAEKVH